jgi:flagellar biosynthesis anti-sigma factor FlgM
MRYSDAEGHIPVLAAPGSCSSSGGSRREDSTFQERLLALLDQIRAMDKTMDEARAAKIANIKKALAAGTYNVSPAEVAQKIIDQMNEP